MQKCEIDEKGQLVNINTKKEGLEKFLPNLKSKISGLSASFFAIGLIASGILFMYAIPIFVLGFAGSFYAFKKSRDEHKKNEEDKIKEIIEIQNINEEIKIEFEKLKESESLIIH